MMVPRMPMGMLWPGMVLAVPSLLNLPMRGPITNGAGQADRSTDHVHHAGTGKVHRAVAKPMVRPRLASQPPPQTQLPTSG